MPLRSVALPFATVAVVLLSAPATASLPGENGRLVFERPNSRGADLFTIGPDGGAATRLTRLRGLATDSSWSPSGRQVAFAFSPNEETPFQIHVINADGTGLRKLTHGKRVGAGTPSWSPDGKTILYNRDARAPSKPGEAALIPLHLYAMDADGSNKRRLVADPNLDVVDSTWSPDGDRIAFSWLRPGKTLKGFDARLAVVGARGGSVRNLTPRGGADELNPNWSPDGKTIVFEENRFFNTAQSDLATINPDGSGRRLLTRTKVYETNPVWSPDGSRIGFTSDRDNRSLSKGRLDRGFELYTMAPDGSDVVRLTTNRVAEVFPDWGPLP